MTRDDAGASADRTRPSPVSSLRKLVVGTSLMHGAVLGSWGLAVSRLWSSSPAVLTGEVTVARPEFARTVDVLSTAGLQDYETAGLSLS